MFELSASARAHERRAAKPGNGVRAEIDPGDTLQQRAGGAGGGGRAGGGPFSRFHAPVFVFRRRIERRANGRRRQRGHR